MSGCHGLVLGKFLPPHAGHVYLVEFASRFADRLTVVVGTLPREPIPGTLRYQWMRAMFPDANVVHLPDDLPQQPEEHPHFWELWRSALLRVVPEAVDVVFASDAYGARLAQELGARFVPVDPARSVVTTSGTAIRADPFGQWHHLPRCVRPYFARRVCVFGPESTGKTTLTASLAEHFGTRMVPEYARTRIEASGGDLAEADLVDFARGQVASEDAIALDANRWLFCDTDPLTTAVWSDVLYGRIDPVVAQLAAARKYALTLLCDVDLPWEEDVARYLPRGRRAFFEACEAALVAHDRPYAVVRGVGEARLACALDALAILP